MSKRGSNRQKGAPALPGAGRPATKATLREGVIVLISQVWPDKSNVDLGRGIVGGVESIKESSDRLVTIPQKDGSEIRIVIGE